MNKKKNWLVSSINLMMLSALLLWPSKQMMAQDLGWPRQKVTSAGKVVYYQPQVDAWTDNKQVTFRTAMTVTPTGGAAVTGVAVIQAATDVDVDDRTVLLHDLEITDTRFPTLDATAAATMDKTVRSFLPKDASISISLDRLVASVAKSDDGPAVTLKNDPPVIYSSERPAILLQMDGEPVWGKIKDTKLEFVVNSNFPVFVDRSKNTYYLFTGQQWLLTQDLHGQWSKVTKLPDAMNKLKKDPQWAGLASVIPAKPIATAAPAVFYSTAPAEVILFQGKPIYTAIPGTGLVYASNTDSDLFVHNLTQTYYYLAAGRWFRAAGLTGPWSYAGEDLPADFSKIPDNSVASRVMASVPGTEQARDAVLLARIPTTAIVDAASAAASVNVTYNGAPDFKPIEGTSLYYATNTAEKVVRVDSSYYLCLNGVWFLSPQPQGPWTTAPSVPAAIYSIPPSSPVYNVTYVTQTSTSPGVIQSSYTAGYLGTFVVRVGFGFVMLTGSGYYYPPYFYYPPFGYPVYWRYAATYGVGAYYNHYTGAYLVARGVYGPYRGVVGRASYNPYTGTYARSATAYGPYGSASVGRAYNPYTGTRAATVQRSSPYGQWGTSVVRRGNQVVQTGHVTNANGTIAGARSTSGAKAVVGRGNYNSGGVVKTAGGDIYAGSNGNVYKKTSTGWQQQNGAKPKAAQTRVPPRPDSVTTGNLNREMQNRQRGAIQTRGYQMQQRGFGGGARRGGFGGRRR